MKKALGIGAGLGASIGFGLAFFLDPKRGKHRRAIVAHSMTWLSKNIGKGIAWPIARIV